MSLDKHKLAEENSLFLLERLREAVRRKGFHTYTFRANDVKLALKEAYMKGFEDGKKE